MTGPGTKEVPGPCGEPDIAPDKAHPGVKHSGREAQSVMGVPSRAVLGRALRGKQERVYTWQEEQQVQNREQNNKTCFGTRERTGKEAPQGCSRGQGQRASESRPEGVNFSP